MLEAHTPLARRWHAPKGRPTGGCCHRQRQWAPSRPGPRGPDPAPWLPSSTATPHRRAVHTRVPAQVHPGGYPCYRGGYLCRYTTLHRAAAGTPLSSCSVRVEDPTARAVAGKPATPRRLLLSAGQGWGGCCCHCGAPGAAWCGWLCSVMARCRRPYLSSTISGRALGSSLQSGKSARRVSTSSGVRRMGTCARQRDAGPASGAGSGTGPTHARPSASWLTTRCFVEMCYRVWRRDRRSLPLILDGTAHRGTSEDVDGREIRCQTR